MTIEYKQWDIVFWENVSGVERWVSLLYNHRRHTKSDSRKSWVTLVVGHQGYSSWYPNEVEKYDGSIYLREHNIQANTQRNIDKSRIVWLIWRLL